MSDSATIVVHVLRAGRTLCSRPGVPCDWPKHHRWIAWNNVTKHLTKFGSARYCKRCLATWGVDREMQRVRTQLGMFAYRENGRCQIHDSHGRLSGDDHTTNSSRASSSPRAPSRTPVLRAKNWASSRAPVVESKAPIPRGKRR